MKLEGSCHCGAVRFSLIAGSPVPYLHCYCTICRKTGGGGGYAINLGGDAASLKVEGEDQLSVYQAKIEGSEEPSTARRHFCKKCGSALWVFDPRWPELIHPFASAIDTPLPTPPEQIHIMLDFKAPWVEVPAGPRFTEYPEESLAKWHARHGLTSA
ncbi:MAG: GFA family protein [Pseudomonadota bacterium]